MSLAAGRLRDRISIERQNLVDNNRGGRKTPAGQAPWLPVDTGVPAEVVPLRGGEALDHLVQRAKQLWRVTIRVRGDVAHGMRLVWTDPALGEVVGNIRSMGLNDSRDGLVMTVESNAGAG